MSNAPRWSVALGLGLTAAFVLQSLAFVGANGQTYDEGVNLAAGLRFIETGRDDINLEHPPLGKVISAWPVELLLRPRMDVAAWAVRRDSAFGLGRDLLFDSGIPYRRLLWTGRLPVVCLSMALLGVIAAFAWRTWGARAGLLALALAAFDPTLIAHGSLISMDVPLALWVTAGFFCVSEWIRTPRLPWLWLSGVFAGLAAATKHSGPMFAATMCIALGARALQQGDVAPWWDTKQPAIASRTRALLNAVADGLVLLAIAALVVRIVMGSGGWQPYLAGIRAQLAHQRAGHPAFFLGDISTGGWVAYFPVALAMKLPPATLIFAVVAVLARRRDPAWRAAVPTVLLPLLLGLMSLLFARIDIGVRYALPLWPLIIVTGSRIAAWPARMSRSARAVVALVLLQHVAAAIRIAPHDLAFFSDLVGGPRQGRHYLADSNLDWGQDISSLGRWLEQHERPRRLYLAYFGTADPRAYGVHYRPAPNSCPHPAPWVRDPEPAAGRELLAVSAMNLQGVYFGDRHAYSWLDTRRPVAVLGYSIWIYDITNDADAHEALARMYERFGPSDLAADERSHAIRLRAGVR
jgi:hypothetical protein